LGLTDQVEAAGDEREASSRRSRILGPPAVKKDAPEATQRPQVHCMTSSPLSSVVQSTASSSPGQPPQLSRLVSVSRQSEPHCFQPRPRAAQASVRRRATAAARSTVEPAEGVGPSIGIVAPATQSLS
jgi:hypothetical protein